MIQDNILKIKYPRGQMNLVIDRFFPATLEKARLVFRLMRDHSTEDDISAIYNYLDGRRHYYKTRMEHYATVVSTETRRKEVREASLGLHESRALYIRSKRNMELLKEITKMEALS
jgi:hypothetical protein